jgi:predicted nucleotidyltransferase
MATADKPARIDAPALAEFVRRLVEIYHPLRIYLFGSRARGDWGPDSDYDLMIVVPDDEPEETWQREAVQEAQSETRAWSDVLVWSQDRFDGRLHLKASFPSTILREGALVYTADPVRPHDTAEWLALAQENLRAAQVALTLPYYEDVARSGGGRAGDEGFPHLGRHSGADQA